MQNINRSIVLISLLTLLIAIAGCTATDTPANATTGDPAVLPNTTVESAVLFGQMHVKMLEGTDEVFEYIISGDSDDKMEFLLYTVRAGVLNDEIQALTVTSGRSELLSKEYNSVDNSRTAVIISALAVIDEYETNGKVQASSLQAFEDDLDQMKSAFDKYADLHYAAVSEGGRDLSGNAAAAISLLKMQEELLEPVGESLEYVTLGNDEEKEEFYAGMDRFMAEAEAFNDTPYLHTAEGAGVAEEYQAMMDTVAEYRLAADILFTSYEADKQLSGEDFDAYETAVDRMREAYETLMRSVLAEL